MSDEIDTEIFTGDNIMYICTKCKEEIGIEQPETGRSFPAYSVIGGLIGAVGAAVTGTLLVVPATVIAGAVADMLTRSCGICGSEIPEGQDAYRLMEELGDESGGQTYRPVGRSDGTAQMTPQRSGLGQFQHGQQPPQEIQETSQNPSDVSQESDDQRTQEFVFDEMEGKLVPRDLATGEKGADIDLADGLGDNAEVDFETQQFFGLHDETGAPDADHFRDFADDARLDVDPFEPFDEPPVGGP